MTDHRSLPPLRIQPRLSWRLLAFVILTHVAALAVLLSLSAPTGWTRLGLGALVLLSLGYAIWAQVLRRAPWSVVAVDWNGLGWQATFGNGRSREVRLMPTTYVGVGLVIVHLQAGRLRRPTLLLSADAVPASQLRRLRVLLRLGMAGGAGDGEQAA
jgi:hypothetical protein